MIINIKVKPNSSKQDIEEFGDGHYLVHLKSPPEHDKANIELLNMLSRYFGISVERFKIKFGQTSDKKIIEIH
jgi:uncharacterized protein (TIGR00251 family)